MPFISKYSLLILLTPFLLISGETSITKHNSQTKNINHQGISFKYKFGEISEFGENFLIETVCTIKNQTERDINYLCESCNGLEYYLVTDPVEYFVMPIMNCNATFPIIHTLNKNEQLTFTTYLFKDKNAEPLNKIGLDFREVKEYIPFDTLRKYPEMIETEYRAETKESNIIWE